MLLLASYGRLAEATAAAVAAFADDPPADRAFVSILAHRHWALAHRNEFNLIFTDQLPGYAAPPADRPSPPSSRFPADARRPRPSSPPPTPI